MVNTLCEFCQLYVNVLDKVTLPAYDVDKQKSAVW